MSTSSAAATGSATGPPQRTYARAANEAMRLAMAADPTVILMGEDVGAYGNVFGVTQGLIDRFGPERVLDTPISETTFVGAAVGAAMCGMRPVVELMFMDFIGFALNPLINQAAKARYMFGGGARVPLVMRTAMGGTLGAAAQHSQTLYSMCANVPGLVTVAPATPHDLKGLLLAAIQDDNPVVVCEHKALYSRQGPVPEDAYVLPLGRASVVRDGSDVTIVAASLMLHRALEAAGLLHGEGVSVEVIDPMTIYPLDAETIVRSVKKTGRLVVVDEGTSFCGFGSEVVSQVARNAFDALEAPPTLITPPHTPVPFSPPLEEHYLPDAADVADAVRASLDTATGSKIP